MTYELIIFDFDGTLANSFPWFVSALQSVAAKYRFHAPTDDEIGELRLVPPREIIRRLGIPWWKMFLIARDIRALMSRSIDQITLFEGIEDVLAELATSGVQMALVTSNSVENARRVLGPTNAARIGHYAGNVRVLGKRANFQRMLRQTGVAPERALCIGDELRDLEAAQAAGIPFGAVGWGFTPLTTLASRAPTERFATVADLHTLITQLGQPRAGVSGR